MKQQIKLLAIATAVAIAASSNVVMAESSSGYDNTVPINNVTAKVEVDVNVLVPKVILLRVGPGGGLGEPQEDQIGLTGSIAGMTPGNNQSFAWNGTAPTFSVVASGGLLGGGKTQAWAWTNSSGGGKVTCATIGPGASIAGSVSVTSVGTLAHPGANTSCGGTTNFPKHLVATSTWQYGMSSAAMGALDAGTYHLDVFYTATSL
jgi:hypothetical protein